MGKDQELLEAARTGNLQSVKTILSGKLPRSDRGSGGLTGGLRRCEMIETDSCRVVDEDRTLIA